MKKAKGRQSAQTKITVIVDVDLKLNYTVMNRFLTLENEHKRILRLKGWQRTREKDIF